MKILKLDGGKKSTNILVLDTEMISNKDVSPIVMDDNVVNRAAMLDEQEDFTTFLKTMASKKKRWSAY